MKTCPRCNREYDEKLDHCLICGSELIEYTPILSETEREALELNGEVTDGMLEQIDPENLPEVIVSVVGKVEAVRLSNLMQEYRIPCMCRENEEEADVFDLLIPKKKFNQAIELLNEDEAAMAEEEEDFLSLEEETLLEELPQEEEPAPAKKKKWFDFFR
ncbi:MAG: hypothetical protein IKM39_03335 [Clostridia bacterium]|nr:hypothetical protein [Clostridia bacterium]